MKNCSTPAMLAYSARPYSSASRAGRARVLKPRCAPKRITNRTMPGVERTSSKTASEIGWRASIDAASKRGLARLPNGASSSRANTCIAPISPVMLAAKVAS